MQNILKPILILHYFNLKIFPKTLAMYCYMVIQYGYKIQSVHGLFF